MNISPLLGRGYAIQCALFFELYKSIITLPYSPHLVVNEAFPEPRPGVQTHLQVGSRLSRR